MKLDSYRKMQKTQSDIVASKEESVSGQQRRIEELEGEIEKKRGEVTQLREKNTALNEVRATTWEQNHEAYVKKTIFRIII